jgi:integrase/recombinase XerD
MQYKIALKRFLDKYGKKVHNKELSALANFEISNGNVKRKLPTDLLTEEDIRKLIINAEGIRNKALIAVLYETGARRGEIENCKLKDVTEFHRGTEHGYHLRILGKTGEQQVVMYRYQRWLRSWFQACNNNDPDTPLFPTTRKYSENSFQDKEQAKNEPHKYTALKGNRVNQAVSKLF